jgi:molybdate transport system substrate-binding protein
MDELSTKYSSRQVLRYVVLSALVGLLMLSNRSVRAQEAVRLYAAGSLRVALTEVAQAFEQQERIPVATEFGASGLLRKRIEKGAPAEVFASAEMGHPETLHKSGRSGPVMLFARNQLCALRHPK